MAVPPLPKKQGLFGDPLLTPLHRKILENHLVLGAKQFLVSRFLSDRDKTAVNPDGFTRILTMSGQKYARKNLLGFVSLHPRMKRNELDNQKPIGDSTFFIL